MVKGKSSQPDIVLYNYEKKKILIFDISVVKKKYLNKTFKDKQEKYNQLGLNLKLMKNFNYYKVIPIIITNEGLICKKTTELLKEINVEIEWGKTITKVLLHNVQLIYRIYTERGKWRRRRHEPLRN